MTMADVVDKMLRFIALVLPSGSVRLEGGQTDVKVEKFDTVFLKVIDLFQAPSPAGAP
jgi:hypothetical protein